MSLQSFLRLNHLRYMLGNCGMVRSVATAHSQHLQTFSEVADLRQKQALQSLLVQVSSVDSGEHLGAYLRQYGTISNIFHFTAQTKEFLFVEMSSRAEAEAVMRHAGHPAVDSVVPVTSPLLWFGAARGQSDELGPADIPAVVQQPDRSNAYVAGQLAQCPTLDAQLLRHHELTCLTALGSRLRYFTCQLLQRALSGLFPHARVSPFGSSANGFGRHDCDVDMALELSPARPGHTLDRLSFHTMAIHGDARLQTQRYLTIIGDLLSVLMPGCQQVRKILKARVPIVKYTQSLIGVDCDLSMQRDGLDMTELLYIWGQLDWRVAPLIRAVRHWAEKVHLTSAVYGSSGAGHRISNFGLTLLVIYFLQTRPVPVLPSLSELAQRARPSDTVRVDDIEYAFLRDPNLVPVTENTEPLSRLLAEFFALYASLDLDSHAVSVVWPGKSVRRAASGVMYVQNPLHQDLNVTRNVTRDQMQLLASESARAVRLIEAGNWSAVMLDNEAGFAEQLGKLYSVHDLFNERAPTEKPQFSGQFAKESSAQPAGGVRTSVDRRPVYSATGRGGADGERRATPGLPPTGAKRKLPPTVPERSFDFIARDHKSKQRPTRRKKRQ